MKTISPEVPAGQTALKRVPPEDKTAGANLAIILGVIALAIACFAVSSQSFWIDEAASVHKALQPSFPDWYQTMQMEHGSDKQMPFYMFLLWAWQSMVPSTEWWLRASGIPFFVAGLYIFAGNRAERWAVAMLSAFSWYCLDEVRPYAMQLGSSLACFGALEHLAGNLTSRSERTWTGIFLLSLIALAGSSLLGMIWSAAVLGAFVVIQFHKTDPWGLVARQKASWIFGGLFLAGLAMYYLSNLGTTGASSVGKTDWRNILFAVSEILGFTGLGPARLELRAAGAAALRPYILPLLSIAGLTAAVMAAGLRRARPMLMNRRGFLLATLMMIALATLLAIGVIKHFRVLGRHCTPLIPVVFWILAEGISELWKSRKLFQRSVVVAFLIATSASCLSFRLVPRHEKDDYRGATLIAQNALSSGQMVWWAADFRGGMLYGLALPLYPTLEEVLARVEPGSAVYIWNCPTEKLSALPRPDLVVLSKPDLFDPFGTLRRFLEENRYVRVEQKQAFDMWRPSAPPSPAPAP